MKKRCRSRSASLPDARTQAFSFADFQRLVPVVTLLLVVNAAGATGAVLLAAARHEQVSSELLRNESVWTQYSATLLNNTVERTCNRCCVNGIVKKGTGGSNTVGAPLWSSAVVWTIHSAPERMHSDVGDSCVPPETLAATCEPTPCSLPAWCADAGCRGDVLWTHPRDTARQQQRTVQAELLVGPLLLVAAGLVDAYFCSRLLRRLLRGHWYRRASGGRGGELALEDIRGSPHVSPCGLRPGV